MTKQWWEIGTTGHPDSAPMVRAVAYYRHSTQDRQENSIPIQQDQVREWAGKNGVEIIHEFADAGKSGLNAEGRPAFTEMMDDWVKRRSDFDYVLCLDVSRWGDSKTLICRRNSAPSVARTRTRNRSYTPASASLAKTIRSIRSEAPRVIHYANMGSLSWEPFLSATRVDRPKSSSTRGTRLRPFRNQIARPRSHAPTGWTLLAITSRCSTQVTYRRGLSWPGFSVSVALGLLKC